MASYVDDQKLRGEELSLVGGLLCPGPFLCDMSGILSHWVSPAYTE